ncbi:1309_t:CDS:2 [Entrophospora sp. SA101]|nr:1309_t:CDS:2 [Entrophospora sp. SA101]
MTVPSLSFRASCILAILIRVVMLIYGEWQDANMQVKYTDIDYKVYSDAARFVAMGESPYKRATYRYTPLLAFLLLPNVYLHKSFGKLLFVSSDILVGVLIYRIVCLRGLDKQKATIYSSLWLLNPVVANISTRGSAESLISAMVLLSLYLMVVKRFKMASALYGLSVHFKIYPIIYSIPLLVLLDDEDYWGIRRKGKEKEYDRNSLKYWTGMIKFLDETYLYHIIRKDHRHNFSIWFYYIYLTIEIPRGSFLWFLTFLPQLSLVTLLGFVFGKDIFFAGFIQTFVFVIYNKVCTSQYFMWYICLFPLIVHSTAIKFKYKGFLMLFAWVIGQEITIKNRKNNNLL